MRDTPPAFCEVCSEPLDAANNACCRSCGRFFHLTWDTRLEPKDCGRFAIDEASVALYFTCNTCLGGAGAPP